MACRQNVLILIQDLITRKLYLKEKRTIYILLLTCCLSSQEKISFYGNGVRVALKNLCRLAKKREVPYKKMRWNTMFIIAVCVIFLIKVKGAFLLPFFISKVM